MASKFLVIWRLELSRISPEAMQLVLRQQDYGAELEADGKLDVRYHLIGGHGGVWIYNVESNEELDGLLARAPVYNVASYEVHPLAVMRGPTPIGTLESE